MIFLSLSSDFRYIRSSKTPYERLCPCPLCRVYDSPLLPTFIIHFTFLGARIHFNYTIDDGNSFKPLRANARGVLITSLARPRSPLCRLGRLFYFFFFSKKIFNSFEMHKISQEERERERERELGYFWNGGTGRAEFRSSLYTLTGTHATLLPPSDPSVVR